MTLDELHQHLDARDAAEFSANLEQGEMSWIDPTGSVVATARCAAAVAWNEGSKTWCWASALAALTEDPIHHLPAPEGEPTSAKGDRAAAEEAAQGLAREHGAAFVYAAPLGGGCVFLAVTKVELVEH